MSDCPACVGIEGYTLHTCGRVSEADINLSDAKGPLDFLAGKGYRVGRCPATHIED